MRSAVRAARQPLPHLRWSIPAAIAAAVLVLLFVRGSRREAASAAVVVANYIELPASAGLPAPAATAILRVQLSGEDLRLYGVDVPPPAATAAGWLSADFVIGEDGLARAVRLVP